MAGYRVCLFLLVILAARARQAPQALPLSFEPNGGQAEADAAYVGHARAGAVLLGRGGATLRMAAGAPLTISLRGALSSFRIEGEDPSPGVANYIRGRDRRQWVTGVPQFRRVRYRGVYPGIDLVFYGAEGALEYDFEVAAGADPRRIRLRIGGASRMAINAAGDLEIESGTARIVHRAPVIYQTVDDLRHAIAGRLVVRGNDVSFAVADYDRSSPLVIDPVLSYSTYLSGRSRDFAAAVAVDAPGSAYVAGYTVSADLPVTAGALQTKHAGTPNEGFNFVTPDIFDAFIAKFSLDGSQLIYCTYLGGRDDDRVTALAVDRLGNAVVAGNTRSSNFPVTQGALMATLPSGGKAGFLTKLNANGTDLIYSTYITGPNSNTTANALALDAFGNVWIAGATGSPNFPVTAASYQPKLAGGQDGYVLKLNPQASAILYGTFLGGKKDDLISAIAVDAVGNCYLAGSTFSPDFPATAGAAQTKLGSDSDGFAAQLNAAGNALVFSTFAGGAGSDSASAIALGPDNSVYIAGTAYSVDFPTTPGAFQETSKTTATGPSGFVMRFDPGGALHYATLVGGSGGGGASGLAVTSDGTAVVVGQTQSPDFPLTGDAYQRVLSGVNCFTFRTPFQFPPTNTPCTDAFLTMVHESGRRLVYSTLLGGAGNDGASSVALSSDGSIYVAGSTGSDDFIATRGAFRTSRVASTCVIESSPTASESFNCEDAFLLKIDPAVVGPVRPVAAVANGSNGVRGPVAAGEFVSLFGFGIGPKSQDTARLGSDGRLLTTLLGTTVTFDGVAAPLLYAGPNQINCIVPFAVATRQQTTVRIDTPDYGNNVASLSVAATAPGLFSLSGTGQGQAAALNQDGSVNGPSNAAARGTVLVLYGTGGGQTVPAGVDGRPAVGLSIPAASVSVNIGGQDARVLYAGNAPGLVEGVLQVNVLVPDGVTPGGQAPIVLTAGGATSQALLYVAIR